MAEDLPEMWRGHFDDVVKISIGNFRSRISDDEIAGFQWPTERRWPDTKISTNPVEIQAHEMHGGYVLVRYSNIDEEYQSF